MTHDRPDLARSRSGTWSAGAVFGLLGLLLAVSACAEDAHSGPASTSETPSGSAGQVAGEIEAQEISFRIAGFVKAMGIT